MAENTNHPMVKYSAIRCCRDSLFIQFFDEISAKCRQWSTYIESGIGSLGTFFWISFLIFLKDLIDKA